MTVSHAADEVADHEQLPPVVTVTEPVAASAPAETPFGAMVMSHVPAWATVTVRPATVSVPLRGDVDVFAATRNATAPLPLVLGPAPDVIVIQDALLEADQTHPEGIVTDTTRDPPVASKDSAVDDTVAVHAAPAWVTVSERPPIASVPARDVPAGLASTRYVTVPLPVPDAPVSTVIQETPGTADHAQPPGRVTFVLPFPPAAEMLCAAGLRVTSHAAPACVTTKGWPATVSVVERELLSGFAATVYSTLALPVPDVADEKVIHETGLWADQAHPEPAESTIVPDPAAAETEALDGEMLYPHPAACVTVTG